MKTLTRMFAPFALIAAFSLPACEDPEPEDYELIDPDDEDEPDGCDDDDAIVDNDERSLDPEGIDRDRATQPPMPEPEPPVFRQCTENPDDDDDDDTTDDYIR